MFSQNWQLINDDFEYHFEENGQYYNTIKIDSFNTIGSDTIYYLNRIVKCVTCSNQNDEYILKNQALFLGKEVLNQSGNYIFFDEEITFINAKATLNSSWVFDTTNNITATISSINFESVLGNMDSTKTISLSNGKEIKISKSYGIVSFLDIYDLSGIQSNSLNIGFRLPDFYDFYNFDIGDVFEYEYNLKCFGGAATCGEDKYTKIEILSKQVFVDSIIYSVNKKSLLQQMHCAGGAGCWPEGDPIPSEENVTLKYYNNDELADAYNTQLINQSNYLSYSLPNLRTISLIDLDSNGLITKYAGVNYDQNINNPFYQLNNGNDSLKNSGPYEFTRALKEGFGVTINSVNYFELTESNILIGSIKNGVQTGTIHNQAFFLGIEEQIEEEKLFSIFPNPSIDETTIVFKETKKSIHVRIYDVLGNEFLAVKGINNKQIEINISDLAKGVYFIKSEADKSYAIMKFIKK